MLAATFALVTGLALAPQPQATPAPAPPAAGTAAELPSQAPDAAATPAPETEVASVVDDLRAAELLLDADRLGSHLAQSFTLIEGGARTAGRFAYLETVRRMHARGVDVRRLAFNDLRIEVYGASAVASYRVRKGWTDEGRQSTQEGWSTDVFERRDDGTWLLVHRQRP